MSDEELKHEREHALWCGQPIKDMSRDELIDALIYCARLYADELTRPDGR